MFWIIEESVGRGYYITLPGIYETKEAAEAAFPDGGKCRAQPYRKGEGNGPIRVENEETDQ